MTSHCSNCELLSINGTVTHELGCPVAWKDYDIECRWCGRDFRPEEIFQVCCSYDCLRSYYSYEEEPYD